MKNAQISHGPKNGIAAIMLFFARSPSIDYGHEKNTYKSLYN